MIRALGRRGVRVLAVETELDAISFHSRFTAERLVHPDPLDEAAFVRYAAELSERLRKGGR